MVRTGFACLLGAWLVMVGFTAQSPADEMDERLKQLDREADELHSRGRLDEAREIRQHMRQLQDRRLAQRAPRNPAENPQLKQLHNHLSELLNAGAEAHRQGQQDRLRELKSQVQSLTQHLFQLEIEKRSAAGRPNKPAPRGDSHEHHAHDNHDHQHAHGDHAHQHGNREQANREQGNREQGNREQGNREQGNREQGNHEQGNHDHGNHAHDNNDHQHAHGDHDHQHDNHDHHDHGNHDQGNNDHGNNDHQHAHGDHDHQHDNNERGNHERDAHQQGHDEHARNPGHPAREQAERISQLRNAARNLHRVGLGDEARVLERRAEEMMRQHKRPQPSEGNRNAQLDELRREIHELRRGLERLQQEIQRRHPDHH